MLFYSHRVTAQQQDQTSGAVQPDNSRQHQLSSMQQDSRDSKDTSNLAGHGPASAAAVVDVSKCQSMAGLRSASSLSIFELYNKKQKAYILSVVSLASLMVPLCDTVYLPALQSIQSEFGTTQQLVAASVAVYMFTVGAASLVWGPAR
ncbi:hypothetical protein COO60DRAFT_518888 [Scenedesmus sp. NREL 46B-D3]|nr:hypothetical protein COO60DRAFT_518888 [Scenedesmus sp. NREL 46B-D3]